MEKYPNLNNIIGLLNEVEGCLMSLDIDKLSMAEYHRLPLILKKINGLQKDTAIQFSTFADEVRKDTYFIEEAAANK